MKNVVIVHKLVIGFLLLASCNPTSAEELGPGDRFQLWNDCQAMDIVVEDLGEDATDIDLTKNTIERAVRSRLRAARIYSAYYQDTYLHIDVSVVGQAFSLSVEYWKLVLDTGSNETDYALTWGHSWLGTHGGDEVYILSSLSESMDYFIDEYLRVNANACY